MNDILLTPIRLNELELLIQNSVRKALLETPLKEDISDKWFDVASLIEYLPEHPAVSTIYAWVHQQEIPFHKRGKKLYFLKSSIDQWLESGRKRTITEIRAAAENKLSSLERKR